MWQPLLPLHSPPTLKNQERCFLSTTGNKQQNKFHGVRMPRTISWITVPWLHLLVRWLTIPLHLWVSGLVQDPTSQKLNKEAKNLTRKPKRKLWGKTTQETRLWKLKGDEFGWQKRFLVSIWKKDRLGSRTPNRDLKLGAVAQFLWKTFSNKIGRILLLIFCSESLISGIILIGHLLPQTCHWMFGRKELSLLVVANDFLIISFWCPRGKIQNNCSQFWITAPFSSKILLTKSWI